MSQTQDRPALLILDVFNTFDFPGGDALYRHALPAVDRIRGLRERFHRKRLPVIFVNDLLGHWEYGFDQLVDHVAASGPHGTSMVRALKPDERDLRLLKPRHSAFFETALPSLLYHLETRQIVVTGIAGDSCVLCTVLDAYVRGFEAIVPTDTTASQTVERNDRVLAHLRETCAVRTPASADVLPD